MKHFLTTPVGRLRLVSILEGISFLVLVLIAMPQKYILEMESAVRIPGMAHGILFVLFCLALFHALVSSNLPKRWAVAFFLGAIVPFGAFIVEKAFRRSPVAAASR